jgi:exodeoxyribonuclease-3
MKIATWNVNGIRARQAQVQEWLDREQPDVLCLQEIKATAEQIPAGLCQPGGYWCFWHGGPKGYSGVSIHVRKGFCPECPVFSHPVFDFESRVVIAQVGLLAVASIYVPNGGKDFDAKVRFLNALEAYADTFAAEKKPLILCGDFNVARTEQDVHPKERNPRVTGQTPDERAWFERLLASGYTDVGRAQDPENDGLFTWWAPWRNMRARNIGWRLDYIIAPERIGAGARSCIVDAGFGTSDHAPVVAVFDDAVVKAG